MVKLLSSKENDEDGGFSSEGVKLTPWLVTLVLQDTDFFRRRVQKVRTSARGDQERRKTSPLLLSCSQPNIPKGLMHVIDSLGQCPADLSITLASHHEAR